MMNYTRPPANTPKKNRKAYNNMEHSIAMLSFTRQYYPGLTSEMVALFDDRDLTEEEARRLISADEYSSNLIVMTKTQYETVFRSLMERS